MKTNGTVVMGRAKLKETFNSCGTKSIRAMSIGAAVFCSILAAATPERAAAADWPLRGTVDPGFVRWDGWQFGVLAGYGNMNVNFANSTSPLVAYILRNSTLEAEGAPSTWTTLPHKSTNGPLFGAFLAYNWQWNELVVGADLSYKRPSILQSSTGDSLRRTFDTSDNISHDLTISAQSSFKLVDYAALRARAGYAFGQFLPYSAIGIAVGRFNYHTTVTVNDAMTQLVPAPPVFLGTFTQTASAGQNNAFVAGFVAALGVDWALTPSIFLRGEWEYVAFAPVNQTRSNVQVGQLALGVRY
jgi:opacity protein-like surface antigen